jgi:hypothetical protein
VKKVSIKWWKLSTVETANSGAPMNAAIATTNANTGVFSNGETSL